MLSSSAPAPPPLARANPAQGQRALKRGAPTIPSSNGASCGKSAIRRRASSRVAGSPPMRAAPRAGA